MPYAMQVHTLEGPRALSRVEIESPQPGPGQVLIQVGAVGCNFADILICQGKYQVKPELPFSPGSEVAGTVAAVGEGVEGVVAGQRVFATMPFGGYASAVLASEKEVYPLPDDMPLSDAAGFGVAYLTAYLALVDRGFVKTGENVLIHAAAGGVGLAALQIAVALGARVIASAGSEDKRALCREHGAADTIDYKDETWPDQIKAMTDGRGADVTYDPVGGDTFDRSTKCIAFDGRLIVIGFASGRIPEIKLNRVMLKNIAVTGFHIGSYREHAPERMRKAMEELLALYQVGKVRPLISAEKPLAEAEAALKDLGERKTTGKLVLIP